VKPFAQSLLALWRELGLNQRVSLAVAGVGVLGALIALVAWSRRPDYQLLYGRLGEKDTSAIVAALQSQNIPFRAPGGGMVYVPANQVHRLRMELAGKGLPTGDGVGFEIFDKGQFGLSDFVQRTNYTRALQGELARTIAQLDGVANARVMIVQPENRLLITEQGVKPTASVFVELSSNRLELEAVNSIRHLVANAVQGLTPDEVAVVDHKGRVLSSDLKDDPTLANASSQMRYRQQVEEYFARKVESMLVPVVGHGNAVVRVSADIDTEAATVTEEKFDPESQVVRTQSSTEDTNSSVESRRGGAVGVSGNIPDRPGSEVTDEKGGPAITNQQNRKNHTTTYEINRSLTNVTRTPGTIRGLTAAVFVAARPPAADGTASTRTPEEIANLQRIVVNALGLKLAPGRKIEEIVSLQETPFHVTPVDEQMERMKQETRWQGWLHSASSYLAVAVALGAFFIFYRMLRSQRPEPVPVELLTVAPATSRNGNNTGTLTAEMLNELIRQKPSNVGATLRDWMAAKKN
jgi:flagellar M-ring protein FliF